MVIVSFLMLWTEGVSDTKMQVFQALVISVLLYGAETWAVTKETDNLPDTMSVRTCETYSNYRNDDIL